MLHQELPRIDATPLDGWGRWLVPAIIAAAALTVALVLLLIGVRSIAALAVVAGAIGAGLALRGSRKAPQGIEPIARGGPDFSLVGSALGLSRDPVALTTSDGTLLVVNTAYRERFGSTQPSN